MGILFSDDIIAVADANISARSVASGFAKADVMDFWHLKLRLRANDLTKSNINPLLIFNLGAATEVVAVLLNDVNFDKARIRGHASNLGTDWSTSSFDSGDVSVGQAKTGRCQGYIPLTSFNYQYLAVFTPAAASAVGEYTTAWEVGTVVILGSATELSPSHAMGYTQELEQPYQDVGRSGRVSLNDVPAWQAEVFFSSRPATDTGVWTFNRINFASPFVFYENAGDTAAAYLVIKDRNFEAELYAPGRLAKKGVRIREIISE